MNEDMKYFSEELEEFLRKGHKLLNKMQQNMGQRGYRGGQGYGNREDGQWNNGGGNMGERGWFGMGGYDPRFM